MRILIIFLFVLSMSNFYACEVCGCAATGGSIGAIGSSKGHLVGFNFQGRYFNSSHPALFSDEIERSKETFYTANLIAKIQLSKRWQLFGVVPYHYNKENEQTGEKTETITQGIGDVSISGRYAIVYQVDSLQSSAFIVQLGTGVKMPTGRYSKNAHETKNALPGTGSWDIPLLANVYYMRTKWMLQWENSFQLKTQNSVKYQFGNSFQSVVFYNRNFTIGTAQFSPGIGLQQDLLMKDKIDGSSTSTFNSGHMTSIVPGINLQWKQLFVVLRYNQPIVQHLSKGYTQLKSQFSASLFYTFK